jgi:hypothetical protein
MIFSLHEFADRIISIRLFSVTAFVPMFVTWNGPSANGASFLFSLSFLLNSTQSPSLINTTAIIFFDTGLVARHL